jgi:predicted RecB family nuclease
VALPVRLVALRKTQDDFYEPVGWSKCGGCGFKEKCWEAAEQCHDVALVPDIDQNLAIALHGIGVTSISQLLQSFDINSLSDFKRPVGKRIQKVGKKAERILRFAMSLESQQELVLAVPAIPTSPNYVMFDLEGMPDGVRQPTASRTGLGRRFLNPGFGPERITGNPEVTPKREFCPDWLPHVQNQVRIGFSLNCSLAQSWLSSLPDSKHID